MSAIRTDKLCKNLGGRTVLEPLSIEIPEGKIVGFVGPDGAGKTTLIRMLAGLMTPTSGTLEVLGMRLPEEAAPLQEAIGYMPQKFGLYEDLSVAENLRLYAGLQSIPKVSQADRIDELLRFTSLDGFGDFLAGDLSGGMKQKLGLACALIKRPKLLLLDEPGVGVDPVSRRELWRMVEGLTQEGVSIIWSTAYMDEAEQCDEVVLLSEGRVLFNGVPSALTARMQGRAFWLEGPVADKRRTLRLALSQPMVKDGTIRGERIRLITDDSGSLPDLDAIHASGCRFVPAEPSFEDGFMDMLGADFDGISPLAEQMGELGNGEGEVIDVRDLTKQFGSFTAAKAISFTIGKGEIFGLLGPNGAGKSTTFKMLCGLIQPSSGEALVLGEKFEDAALALRRKIGYMSQKFSLYGDISVRENLRFFAGIYGLQGSKRLEKITAMLEIFNLEKYAKTPSKELPPGYKQRLALACAVMHDPAILFLDEPTSGVDPVTRREFWNHIYAMVRKGMTVMVTTHFMDEAEYCDRVALIYRGRAVAVDTPKALVERYAPGESMQEAFIRLIESESHAG